MLPWLKNVVASTEEAFKARHLSPLIRTLKPSPFEKIDRGLKAFIWNAHNKGVMVTDLCLTKRAKQLANELD